MFVVVWRLVLHPYDSFAPQVGSHKTGVSFAPVKSFRFSGRTIKIDGETLSFSRRHSTYRMSSGAAREGRERRYGTKRVYAASHFRSSPLRPATETESCLLLLHAASARLPGRSIRTEGSARSCCSVSSSHHRPRKSGRGNHDDDDRDGDNYRLAVRPVSRVREKEKSRRITRARVAPP